MVEVKPKRPRGRPRGLVLHPHVRERIQAGVLIERLQGIASGKYEAQPHQVTAALGLLKKVLPDLQAVEMIVEDITPPRTAEELMARGKMYGLTPEQLFGRKPRR